MAGSLPSLFSLIWMSAEYMFYRFWRIFFGPGEIYEQNVRGKIIVVTGANSGLGKATTQELAKRGATIIMGCRNLVEGQKVIDEIEAVTPSSCSAKLILMKLDLEDFDSTAKFAQDVQIQFPFVNILINNAGIYTCNDKLTCTKDGYETHFQVNHLGHFLLTNLLLSALKRGAPSRIVTVSSELQMLEELDINDLNLKEAGYRSKYGSWSSKPYNNSKYANSLFMYDLTTKLDEVCGVTTYSLCPGLCSTNLFRYLPWYRQLTQKISIFLLGFSPAQGTESILYCALSKLCTSETGLVYHFSKPFGEINKKIRANKELAKQLWNESAKMVKLQERQFQLSKIYAEAKLNNK